MEELITIAGKNKLEVGWLRKCLRENGYHSIPCRTAKQLAQELNILPSCDACVSLALIDPQIFEDIDEDLILHLSECAIDVPFLLFNDLNAEPELIEIFDTLCKYRSKFAQQQNPKLAQLLKENGVAS